MSDGLRHEEPTDAADGTPDLEAILPLARSVARRTLHRPTPVFDYEDAVAAGLVGLVEAGSRHDPSRGDNFPAYACRRVRGAVLDAIRALDHLPQGARKRRARSHLGSVVCDDGLPPPPMSLSRLSGQTEEGDVQGLDIADEDPFFSPEWFADRSETLRELEGALRALPPREREVICLRYWEHRTLADVGGRLGVSGGRVRQIEKRALERLRWHLESGNGSDGPF